MGDGIRDAGLQDRRPIQDNIKPAGRASADPRILRDRSSVTTNLPLPTDAVPPGRALLVAFAYIAAMATDVSIEHLDHTGDAGILVTAPSLARLLVACAEAMTDLRAPDTDVDTPLSREVDVRGWDLAELLVNWLAEVHGMGEAYREIYGRFEVQELSVAAGDCRVRGRALGEAIDPTRHALAREIKAVTHHDAWVRQDEDGRWRAQIIFDL
jgi:SHS2 domain-containing protein